MPEIIPEGAPLLPFIWACIIALGVAMYVLLDGFDLGVGMLFPFFRKEEDRSIMMASVAPIWDGNETWLVLGGSALFGAFPIAYAVVLPALYLPLLVMLIALIFRGVAFEFRLKTVRARRVWDWSFAGGSFMATFAQGVALGAYINGFFVEDREYVGGAFDWLTWFSLFTGLALPVGYTMLGCAWLIIKTEGPLQEKMWRLLPRLNVGVLIAIVAVSIWTPFAEPGIYQRWFSFPNILWFSPVPVLVALCVFMIHRAYVKRQEKRPFPLTMALFLLSFSGLAISLWPNVIPPGITIWEASSPPESQLFLLVGTAILIPIILFYTGYSYWVFRGKVRPGEGYH